MFYDLEQITQGFRRLGERIVRRRWGILVGLLAVTLVTALGLPRLESDASSENALLRDDPLVVAEEEFEKDFGNNEFIGVLVEAENVFTVAMLRLIRELGQELEERVPYADKVVSLTDYEFSEGTAEGIVFRNLAPDELPTSEAEVADLRARAYAKSFLVNRLFSEDATQTWISLRLRPYSAEAATAGDPRDRVARAVLDILAQDKYAPHTLRPAGIPLVHYQEQEFFGREGQTLILLSIVIAVLILAAFLQTVQGVVVPLLSFACATIWVFGGMGLAGIKINTLVLTLPIYLGLAVSVGYSIHIFNFFRTSAAASGNRKDAVAYAIQETGWPLLFTAATTITALVSFFFVPIKHIRWMGLSSAAVIVAVYIIVMTLTPTLLTFGPTLPAAGATPTGRFARLAHGLHERSDHMFIRLSGWVYRHPRGILLTFAAIVLAFLGGVAQVHVSMNFEDTFGLKIPYIRNLYTVGHSQVGSMHSYDVLLRFDQPDAVKAPDVLQRFETLSDTVAAFPLVTRVSSLLDLVKDSNQVVNDNDPAYDAIPDDRDVIAQLLLLHEISNADELANWVDYAYTTLRLMVEVADFDAKHTEADIRAVEQAIGDLFPEARFMMVGSLMKTALLQNYIARGEVISSLIALVVIGILMMIVFRSVKTGLIGMIPNIAPVLVVLGLMGYLKIPIDMTTMVIIPILLGLAVDDTIHFITHCKLEFLRTGRYQDAIQATFRTVGKAIFMTSFILIASFSAYLTSIALFFVRLAALLSAGLIAALLADYFVTPVLIRITQPFGSEP